MPSRFAIVLLLAGILLQPAQAALNAPQDAPQHAPQHAPQQVHAQYDFSVNGYTVAVMKETFEARDGSYQAVSETHAIGLFKLVQRRPGRVTSSGTLSSEGLQPKIFDGTRGNKDARRVHAEFDWDARTLSLRYDERTDTVALPPGTQDRLSVMYQFLFLDQDKLKTLAFPMTNGRKLDHYRYTIGPDTVIDTPLGRMSVVHLVKQRDAGDTATEIWLAREYRLMPIKMRIIEDDGDRYEQIIAQLIIKP